MRKSRIPGVAEVAMPPAAPAPRAERDLDLQMTTDKTGVRVKVGCSFPVTIYPRDLRRIGPMLGMDYAKAINERNAAQSALANRTQERDQARTDHAEADVTLQDTLKTLEKAEKDRDYNAAVVEQRNEMLKALREERDLAQANLDIRNRNFNDATATIRKLNDQLDRIAIDLGTEERNHAATMGQVERLTQAPGLAGRLGRWLWRKAGSVEGEEATR